MNTKAKILDKVQVKVEEFKAKIEKLDFDKVQEKVEEFKAKKESFDMQYSLGRNEARDAFDREWNNFTRFVEAQGNWIRQQGFFSEHTINGLDKALPELQAILKEQIPAKEIAAQQWRERMMRAIYEMEFIIRDLYPNLDENGRELFSSLRINMELYRARITMTPWQEWGGFSTELNALNTKIEEAKVWRKTHREALKKRLEEFGQDVTELFAKVKGKVGAILN